MRLCWPLHPEGPSLGVKGELSSTSSPVPTAPPAQPCICHPLFTRKTTSQSPGLSPVSPTHAGARADSREGPLRVCFCAITLPESERSRVTFSGTAHGAGILSEKQPSKQSQGCHQSPSDTGRREVDWWRKSGEKHRRSGRLQTPTLRLGPNCPDLRQLLTVSTPEPLMPVHTRGQGHGAHILHPDHTGPQDTVW